MTTEEKALSEALSYWKTYAVAREKDLVAAHKDLLHLRNEIEQLRKLRIEDKKTINSLWDEIKHFQKAKENEK